MTDTTKDVPSALMRQTLLDRDLVRSATDVEHGPIRLLPWLDVVVLGGSTVVDGGRETLLPVVDELRSLLGAHRMLILTGAGVRARHVLGVGLDLGLPTGALAGLAATEAEQNGHLVAALLASEGVAYLPHGAVAGQLSVHLAAAPAVVTNGYPPYGVHEFTSPHSKLPLHRTDAGAVLLADALGARSCTYVRDAAALARFGDADRVSATELRTTTAELPLDRVVGELLEHAKHIREVRVVDGTTPGQIGHALAGEPAGVVVHASS
jgi:molybdenum storage protein